MGVSRLVICSIASVLVSLSSASNDGRMQEQRDITFDLDKIMQEMQQPDTEMLQKEVDLLDLLGPEEFPREQVMMSPPKRYDTLGERGQRRVGPRSFAGLRLQGYPVQFPLARPSSKNLQAICLHADHRPRYPDSYFPASGFGQQKRRASAVNKAESWFSMCCQRNETWGREVTLCCATQAWELSVNSFCEEDLSVKDRHYPCCRKTGSYRLSCFHKDAPNPNYQPTEGLPMSVLSTANFIFDPNTCQRTPSSVRGNRGKNVKKASTSQKPDISFPPGRPTADTIESLCHNQKLRPLYTVKCLPGVGYEWLARQAKAINRIEKGFKQCCKKKRDVLNCADQKWREGLNKFCSSENGEQVDFHCCSAADGASEQYSCFQNVSPDPHYNMTSANEELSLSKICDTQKIIKKTFPVGFPLKSFANKCCPLSEQEKTICLEQRLKETSVNLCATQRAYSNVYRCCRTPLQEASQCISNILMDAITKANNVLHQKKRKRCPLS